MQTRIRRSALPAMKQFLIVVSTCAFFYWLCEHVSFYFYPLALFFIGSRTYALNLIGHEAVHGLIFKNRAVNIFFARYFCFFPSFVSYSHYSQLHFMHHRFAKTDKDPDTGSYELRWTSNRHWYREKFVELLTGRIFYYFLLYFSGIPQRLSGNYAFKKNSDHGRMLGFWVAAATLFTVFHGWKYFLLYWFLPLYIWLPWVQLAGVYQHAGEEFMSATKARSFARRPALLNELLLPLNIHLHEAHHQHPTLPYYELPQATRDLQHHVVDVNSLRPLLFAEKETAV